MQSSELIRWAEKHQIEGILHVLKNQNYSDVKEALLHLKTLNASHKRLDSLPNCLFDLSSLEILNLSHNQLTELPQEIIRLKKLKILDISWNHITHTIDFLPSHIKIKKAWNRQ